MPTIRVFFGGMYAALGLIVLFAGPDAVRPRSAYLVAPVFLFATALLILRPYRKEKTS